MPIKTEKNKVALLPEMIPIKGGSFQMGGDQYDDEQPIHKVIVPDFLLGKYPVTNIQFVDFLNAYQSDTILDGPNKGEKIIVEYEWGLSLEEGIWKVATPGFEQYVGKKPVINVTWYGAVAYCEWLSAQTDDNYRLPTEAEWEYAARGGKSNRFTYSGSQKLKEVGWYDDNSHGQTHPVGLKLPNELGLYDMSGNVDEWCADHWHENYKGAPKDGSAWVTGGEATRRVVRGGSWYFDDLNSRVSYRFRYYSDSRDYDIGFRVARY